jgi:hypothetical protein
VRWGRRGLWLSSASEIVCDCGWSQNGGARERSRCGPRGVERGCEMCNFVQTGRGCGVVEVEQAFFMHDELVRLVEVSSRPVQLSRLATYDAGIALFTHAAPSS